MKTRLKNFGKREMHSASFHSDQNLLPKGKVSFFVKESDLGFCFVPLDSCPIVMDIYEPLGRAAAAASLVCFFADQTLLPTEDGP